MKPPMVGCPECEQLMEQVDHKLVPYKQVRRWAIRAGGILNIKGWYWCSPCDEWLHLPTLEGNPLSL